MPITLARRNLSAFQDAEMESAGFLPYLDLNAVLQLIVAAAESHPLNGERDELLIVFLFNVCLGCRKPPVRSPRT